MAAQIRADVDDLKSQWRENWRPEWDVLFVPPPEAVSLGSLRSAYNAYLEALAWEIGARR